MSTGRKDDLMIVLLLLLFMVTLITAFFADRDIDALDKTIDYLISEQESDKAEIEELRAITSEQAETIESLKAEINSQDNRIGYYFRRLTAVESQIEDHENRLSAPTPKAATPTPKANKLNVKVSEADIRDIAALVYLESGSQSYKCQKAIASVIFNRMIRYNMTAQQVIYQRGVFSPANRVSRTTPSRSCLKAVREVLESGATLPLRVTAFRNGRYHSFGSPYCCIDGVYFSKV